MEINPHLKFLNIQRKTDKDLKYSLRPGVDDIQIMIKYKIENKFVRNPFKEVDINEFDKNMELPPIQTLALKIHTDTVVEARFREKLNLAEQRRESENVENNSNEEEFQTERGRKRGFMSPLSNQNKNKMSEGEVSNLLNKFKNKDTQENEEIEMQKNEEERGAAGTSFKN